MARQKIFSNSRVAFIRAIDGVIMAEAIRLGGQTENGREFYNAGREYFDCVFDEGRAKTSWKKQGEIGNKELAKLAERQVALFGGK